MEEQQAEVARVSRNASVSDEDMDDDAMDDWWATVDVITDTPAKTPEGVRAKAGAVRTAVVGSFGDAAPQITYILASLLSDMLG
jgi:hypothetical protein